MPIFLTIHIKCIWSVANLLCFIYSYVYKFLSMSYPEVQIKKSFKNSFKTFLAFWAFTLYSVLDEPIQKFELSQFFFYFGWFLDGFLVYFYLTCLEDALNLQLCFLGYYVWKNLFFFVRDSEFSLRTMSRS
jgi:hypothetical protein